VSSGMIGSVTQAASSLSQARESGMLQQVNGDEKNGDKARIEKASQQFEAMLLGTWLKEAEKSFSSLPGSDSDDATKDQMMSFGVQSLAQSMAANGGIGIGKMIAQAMEAAATKEEAAKPGAATPAQGGKIG